MVGLPIPLPDLLTLHRAAPAAYPYLLQTTTGSGWDILFAYPETPTILDADAAQFADCLALPPSPGDVPPDIAHLPFRGGWFVYFGYELGTLWEPSVVRPSGGRLPLAVVARAPAAILVDRSRQCAWIVAEDSARLHTIQHDLARLTTPLPADFSVTAAQEEDPERYLHGVQRILDYIRAGDVFQVNLSRAWQAQLRSGDAGALYQRLCAVNPAPFAASVRLPGGAHIVSSSPERLVQVRSGRIETRPIAGTCRRDPDPQQDARLRAALAASAKERAEHIMLVDLERNDLGRLARPGSVHVPALLQVESYAFVHHLESVVAGELAGRKSLHDIGRALFPGGTITGCPKVRTMQIIAELEGTPRQCYTGSVGYLNRDGDLDLNILIRTFLCDGDQLQFRTGAGIVADSQPQRELHETREKAAGLLRAISPG